MNGWVGQRWLTWAALGLMLILSSPAAGKSLGASIQSFDTTLTNLESSVNRLSRDYASPVAVLRTHKTESRFIEAKLLFELDSFEPASILLMDLINTDDFKSNPEYFRATLMLGKSLLEMDNERSARRYLRRVVKGPDADLVDEAGYLLVEMALENDDEVALRKLATRIPRGLTGRTRYALGKAWIRLGDARKGLDLLLQVPSDTPLYVRSRYYQGVAMTALKKYAEAEAIFRELAEIKEPDTTKQKVRDLSVLAIGRLLMEQGDLVEAINQYQLISRFSRQYEVALYEMSWAYIKAEEYDKALRTIDALLLTVKDPALDVEAHSLRGRLNLYLNDYESASETFDKIVSRFAPIRNELDRFTRNPDNIQRYFEWLLDRKDPAAKLRAPLTERTSEWVESSGDMGRIATVFSDLSAQKQEVASTKEIAKLLEEVVKSRNRVELFPGLKDGWARSLVLENQLLTLSSNILDHQSELTKRWLESDQQSKHKAMLHWRKELERRFEKLPRSFEQYEEQESKVAERYIDLKRQVFVVGQRVTDIERQILALERYVNDQQYKDGGKKFSEKREMEFRSALDDEKRKLLALQREHEGLEKRLELESRQVGAGDKAGQSDNNLKQALIEAQKAEGLFYDRMAAQAGKATGSHFRLLGDRRERIWSSLQRLREVVAAIDLKVGEKMAELHQEIRRETREIKRYERQLARYAREGRKIGREMGTALFQSAQDSMKSVVLKADVGLIDVAWQMKREKTEAIKKVNRERAGKLSRLRRNLDEMTRDRIPESILPPPPAPPAEPKPAESNKAAESPEPAAESAKEGGAKAMETPSKDAEAPKEDAQ